MVATTKIQPRILEVLAGPAGNAGLLFTREDMEGSVKTFRGSKPNEATVTIHNLSLDTIAQLEAPGTVLQIKAGEAVAGTLFIGDVVKRGVVTKNNQPNRSTTITARDGRRQYRDTTVSTAYPPNTPVATVVQDLLKQVTLPGVGLALGIGSTYPPDIFPAGWAFQGRWRQALDEILIPRQFYWTIQGKVIYVLPQGGTAPGNVPLVSPATGLDGSPVRTDKGCNFKSKLNPAIIAGRGVQVTSQFFNGLYRAVNVTHEFSTDGMKWSTSAQTEVIK